MQCSCTVSVLTYVRSLYPCAYIHTVLYKALLHLNRSRERYPMWQQRTCGQGTLCMDRFVSVCQCVYFVCLHRECCAAAVGPCEGRLRFICSFVSAATISERGRLKSWQVLNTPCTQLLKVSAFSDAQFTSPGHPDIRGRVGTEISEVWAGRAQADEQGGWSRQQRGQMKEQAECWAGREPTRKSRVDGSGSREDRSLNRQSPISWFCLFFIKTPCMNVVTSYFVN